MKLRTQCHEAHGYPVFYTASRVSIERDAAYAHALVQAMDWYKTEARYGHIADVAVALIDKRANELLAEWGYPDR